MIFYMVKMYFLPFYTILSNLIFKPSALLYCTFICPSFLSLPVDPITLAATVEGLTLFPGVKG